MHVCTFGGECSLSSQAEWYLVSNQKQSKLGSSH